MLRVVSDSQNVDVICSMSSHLHNIIDVSVADSILDKKYRGFPVASMKMGYRVWLNTAALSFKTLPVADALKAAQMVEMLETYEVVTSREAHAHSRDI